MSGTDIDLNDISNPEDLAKVFDQLERGEDIAPIDAKKEETPPTVDEGADETSKAQAGKEAAPEDNDESNAEGIATKDGKHVIPYSVLKSERERATKAEQLANEMRERVSFLEQVVSGRAEGAKTGEGARTNEPQPSDVSDADLELLKEDFPTVYKALKASMAKAEALEAKLKPVEESVRTSETERAAAATNAVQDAIDQVPVLAHVQANDPAAFELAKQLDATLRSQSAWANKPLSERFTKVAELLQATMGEIEIPGSTRTRTVDTKPDMKGKAKEIAAQAARATRTNVPTSLSEFPAGEHAAQDEREAAENLSPLQLAEKFAGMTPAQMDAYFLNL